MFITSPEVNVQIDGAKPPKNQPSAATKERLLPSNREQRSLPREVIEELIDGILILTEQKELVYANDCARRILRQLNRGSTLTNLVPQEIWHICQTLIGSRNLFPSQYWSVESDVFIDPSVTFHVWAKWVKLETADRPSILLRIKDQYQSIKDVVMEEAQKYGLTPREKEIWLLHRANYTYKQVASELCITPNTVKKHMKSIYSKQKIVLGIEEF
jgi:DNA-binding CsgD family transcriptional regulator